MSQSSHGFRRPEVVGGGAVRLRRSITDRQDAARRLLFEAAEDVYDGDLDVDWGSAPVPDLRWMPDEFCSLFGTSVWDAMTDGQRRTLRTAEFVELIALAIQMDSVASMIAFKTIARDRVLADDRARFLLTVVDDLARNVTMYSRVISATGVEPAMSRRRTTLPARYSLMLPRRTLAVSVMLLSAQLLGGLSAAVAFGDEVQPHCKYLLEIQAGSADRVTRFARAELDDAGVAGRSRTGSVRRTAHSAAHASLVVSIGWRLISDEAYVSAGVDPVVARAAASARAVRARRLTTILGPHLAICDEDGLVDGQLAGLVLRAGGLRERGR